MRKIIFVASLLFSLSCDKTDINSELIENATVEEKEKDTIPDEGEMILSDKVVNPYEIKNMRVALKSMKQKVLEAKDIEIEPNYKYVRFLPYSQGEYDLINGNSEIDVFEYPLDRKVIKKGNKYIDKSLGNSKFGWIYAAVPIDMKFDPKLRVEIIDLLFLPEGNGRTDEYSKSLDSKGQSHRNLMKELEKESFSIHGDEKYGISKAGKSAKIADWYSSGRIRVQDERLSYNESTNIYNQGTAGWVPIAGCQVRANRWFTTVTSITNTNGTFSINHGWPNGSPVDMDIKWDRTDFDIRTGSYGQAITSNQNILGPWNPNITKAISPDHYIYAHVHRAAWYYYYNNTFGVISPPSANFPGLGGKIHLGAKQGGLASHYFDFNQVFQASEIKLNFDLSTGGSNPEDARYIFNTTIHELTHAAHWKIGMSYSLYVANAGQAKRLAESWADGVAWHITRAVYSPSTNPWEEVDNGNQLMSLPMGTYTPIFIDLMDNYNQIVQQLDRPNDQVSGFTINYLQNVLLQRPINWYMYRDYIQTNPPTSGVTDLAAGIQLFSDYD